MVLTIRYMSRKNLIQFRFRLISRFFSPYHHHHCLVIIAVAVRRVWMIAPTFLLLCLLHRTTNNFHNFHLHHIALSYAPILVRKRLMDQQLLVVLKRSFQPTWNKRRRGKTTYSLIFQVWNRNKKGNGSFMHHIGVAAAA